MLRWVVERDQSPNAHRLTYLGNAAVTNRTDPALHNVETRTTSGCLLTPRLTHMKTHTYYYVYTYILTVDSLFIHTHTHTQIK